MDQQNRVTQLLNAAESGDGNAPEELLPLVYEELRRLAHAQMAREGPGQTLQPTALVHESYLRLVGNPELHWKNRRHFFLTAARAMRRILVDRARRVRSQKHGGAHRRVPLTGVDVAEETDPEVFLMVDEALDRLRSIDERKADVVQLRYFGGLTVDEVAATLDVSPTTVKDEWSFARAWLLKEVRGGE